VRQQISKSIFAKRTAVSRLWSSLSDLHEANGKHNNFTVIKALTAFQLLRTTQPQP